MSRLFNKYKYTILSLFICFLLLYTIHFYMNHSALKLILWILIVLTEGCIIQYQKKLNKKK